MRRVFSTYQITRFLNLEKIKIEKTYKNQTEFDINVFPRHVICFLPRKYLYRIFASHDMLSKQLKCNSWVSIELGNSALPWVGYSISKVDNTAKVWNVYKVCNVWLFTCFIKFWNIAYVIHVMRSELEMDQLKVKPCKIQKFWKANF